MTKLQSKGNYHLCRYESGLYTVDKITKSVGMTIKASDELETVKKFFDNNISDKGRLKKAA